MVRFLGFVSSFAKVSVFFVNVFCCVLLANCNKKEDSLPVFKVNDSFNKVDITNHITNALLVTNEGNYGWGSGSLSLVGLADQKWFSYTDAFSVANGRVCGNVAQSCTIVNGKIWLIVNNSEKIEVLNPKTLASEQIISMPGKSPRYAAEDTVLRRAIITDLYANKLSIYNTVSNAKITEVFLPGWTEQVVADNKGFAYVLRINSTTNANAYKEGIFKIDLTTASITDSILVGSGCSNLHLLSTGICFTVNKPSSSLGAASTKSIFVKADFGLQNRIITYFDGISTLGSFALNQMADSACFTNADNGKVYLAAMNASIIVPSIIQRSFQLAYKVGRYRNYWVVADAKDYQSAGSISLFTNTQQAQNPIASLATGIIPSNFLELK